MSDVVLYTKDLTKKYEDDLVVNKVNIKVLQGDIYGLVGKNGAGKTTLLRMIGGLTPPSGGTLGLFSETAEKGLSNGRSRTGCMIETPCFFPYLSAKQNLMYYKHQRGIPGTTCIEEALGLVGLSDTGNKKFKSFSLGMKQRLGLALAVLTNPDLLILDEPINGLDPMGIVELREILKKLNGEKSTTILLSSHILGELSQLATKYGFIHEGILLEELSTERLREKCRHGIFITVHDTGKASVVLEKKLSCTDYEVLNSRDMKIFGYVDTPELLVQTLVQNDILISVVHQTGANLEDYFIRLIGGNPYAESDQG